MNTGVQGSFLTRMREKREVTFLAPKGQTANVYTPENMGTKSPKHCGVERRCTMGTRVILVPHSPPSLERQHG
jgi:hypothetical protein